MTRHPRSRSMQPLTKQEIDQRIDRLVVEMAAEMAPESGNGTAEANDDQPRWIAAQELIRRMRPFVIYN